MGGETVHRLAGIGIGTQEETMSNRKKAELVAKFAHLLCLIIDERSLLGASDIGKAENRIRTTLHNSLGNLDQLFGGLPVVILVGDDYQLPAQNGIIQTLNEPKTHETAIRGIEVI